MITEPKPVSPWKSAKPVTVAGTALTASSDAVAIHVTTAGVVTFTMEDGGSLEMYLAANTPYILALSIVNISAVVTAVLGKCYGLYGGANHA